MRTSCPRIRGQSVLAERRIAELDAPAVGMRRALDGCMPISVSNPLLNNAMSDLWNQSQPVNVLRRGIEALNANPINPDRAEALAQQLMEASGATVDEGQKQTMQATARELRNKAAEARSSGAPKAGGPEGSNAVTSSAVTAYLDQSPSSRARDLARTLSQVNEMMD